MDTSKLPKHVAIIPDGNRRWAKERGLPTLEGHRRGAENFEKLVDTANEMGIEVLTGWFFSTENWKRSENEVNYLFQLVRDFTDKYRKKCVEDQIRFRHFGRRDRLPRDLVKSIEDTEAESKDFKNFTVGACMDYGGHDELVRTIKKLQEKGLEPTEENIEANLDTFDVPNPDLIIRTSGEQRLSGFMSWQTHYAEFYFAEMHFPDFGPEEFKNAIAEFTTRERRFGGNSKK